MTEAFEFNIEHLRDLANRLLKEGRVDDVLIISEVINWFFKTKQQLKKGDKS